MATKVKERRNLDFSKHFVYLYFVHGIQAKDSFFGLFGVDCLGIEDALEIPDPDPTVGPDGDELTLLGNHLVDLTLVASRAVFASDFQLDSGSFPHQYVAPVASGNDLMQRWENKQ